MGEKQGERFIQVLFIGLIVAAIFLPAKYTFMGFVGLVAMYLVVSFVSTARFDEISNVLGIYLALIVLIEGGHAGAALASGVPMKGGNVTLLGVADGVGVGPSGWVELDIEKADVDASPELMSKVSWISAAGSLILIVFGALYFILRSKDEFPAIMATLFFFLHQAPFLLNDQSMCISNGWMSSTFAYAIFIGGLIVLGITFRFRRGEKKKRNPYVRVVG